jgi:hypothetical protein
MPKSHTDALRESRDLFRTLLDLHEESDYDQITGRVEVHLEKLNGLLAQPLAPAPGSKGTIVAFCGPEGCGKSFAAEHLIANHGFVRFSFADPIREMLRIIGVTDKELSDRVLKESPCAALHGRTPRHAMKTLGTEWGRDMIDIKLWSDLALKRLLAASAAGLRVVLDDCRFDNEAETWIKSGGVILEIRREGCNYDPAHASSAGLSRQLIDAIIDNKGTPEFLLEVEKLALDKTLFWSVQ